MYLTTAENLQMVRYLPVHQGGHLVLECHPSLARHHNLVYQALHDLQVHQPFLEDQAYPTIKNNN